MKKPLALTDNQLHLIKHAARSLLVDARDHFLQSVAAQHSCLFTLCLGRDGVTARTRNSSGRTLLSDVIWVPRFATSWLLCRVRKWLCAEHPAQENQAEALSEP